VTEQQFLDLAAAILDGAPVAWDSLPEPATAADRDLLGRLRQLAGVTGLHRVAQPLPGTRWGPLVIVERVGSGTFGDVYRASDPALDRDVALKLLRSPAAGRHLTEGQLLARVRHPNVVTVFGAAEYGGSYGIWMEFVKGRTLAQLVTEHGPFAATEVSAIGIDLCSALAAVHASGLLHGDIKAQNVMREDSGRVVLMDFGTGRIADDDSMAAVIAGTPLYVAPEIFSGGSAETTSDIYGIGVLLYFLLTGAFPIEGRTLSAIRAAHGEGRRVPVRVRRPDVSPRLAEVIDRAVAPVPGDRMQSAVEFEQAIAASTQASRLARRRWLGACAAAILVCAIGGSAAAIRSLGIPWPWTVVGTHDLTTGRVFPAAGVAFSFGPPSADGRYIAFSQFDHSLSLLDLTTGKSRVLFSGADASDSAGSISADSKQIAYAWWAQGSAGPVELRVADIATRETRTVFTAPSLAYLVVFDWLKTGKAVLVLMHDKDGAQTLAMISLGDGATRVLKHGNVSMWKASLSPDGRFVAYDGLQDPGPNRGIWIVSSEGGAAVQLPVGSASSPAWTPDGQSIIYQSDRTGSIGAWMVPIVEGRASGDPTMLSRSTARIAPLGVTGAGAYYYLLQSAMVDVFIAPVDPVSGRFQGPAAVAASNDFMGSNWFPDWSSDGQQLAYSSARNERLTPTRVLRIRPASEGSGRELPLAIPFFDALRWAPDGRALLVRGTDVAGRASLLEVDVRTGKVLKSVHTAGRVRDFEWSSNGRRLFYTIGRGDFFVRDADGAHRPIPYADSAQKHGMAKSPDDQWLAFTRSESGAATLSVIPASGGRRRDLLRVSLPDFVFPEAWTADGRYLLFTRWRANAHGADEGDRRTLWRIAVNGAADPEYLGLSMPTMRHVRLSPTGTHLAFTSGYAASDLWVMRNFSTSR
jgi:Tol biopolymer transport system component